MPAVGAKRAQSVERVEIGPHVLYYGDCLDVLPKIIREADACLTDPPYGINYGRLLRGKGDGAGGIDKNGWRGWDQPTWDEQRPSREIFDLILSTGKHQIVWGCNYFTDMLPPTMQWLVWDKMQRDFSLADCEFAWSSQRKASRIFSYSRGAALGDGRCHPTQKPVELMKWCLKFLADSQTIVDPFMGVGSTGVACCEEGRTFIGIEKDLKYFRIAIARMEHAVFQVDPSYRAEKIKRVEAGTSLLKRT